MILRLSYVVGKRLVLDHCWHVNTTYCLCIDYILPLWYIALVWQGIKDSPALS